MLSKLEDLKQEIGMDSIIDLNQPYVPLAQIMKECGVDSRYGNFLLQYHGYRNQDGIWSQEMVDHGYVLVTSFTLWENTRLLSTRFNNELVAPHAIDFFKVFFNEANLN